MYERKTLTVMPGKLRAANATLRDTVYRKNLEILRLERRIERMEKPITKESDINALKRQMSRALRMLDGAVSAEDIHAQTARVATYMAVWRFYAGEDRTPPPGIPVE